MSGEIELTKEILTQARRIAVGRGIRDVERLVRQYGGQAKHWRKMSSQTLQDSHGAFEYHWYEHYGIGRFEVKKLYK